MFTKGNRVAAPCKSEPMTEFAIKWQNSTHVPKKEKVKLSLTMRLYILTILYCHFILKVAYVNYWRNIHLNFPFENLQITYGFLNL